MPAAYSPREDGRRVDGCHGSARSSDPYLLSRRPVDVPPTSSYIGVRRCGDRPRPPCNPPAATRGGRPWLSAALSGSHAPISTRETASHDTRQHYLAPALLPSHGGNTGSNPVCAASFFGRERRGFVYCAPAAEGLQQPSCNPSAARSSARRWRVVMLDGTRRQEPAQSQHPEQTAARQYLTAGGRVLSWPRQRRGASPRQGSDRQQGTPARTRLPRHGRGRPSGA